MQTVLLGEYRNQNSQRRYPFSDEATMVDANGNSIPTDFLIDAFLYCIDLQGSIYMSSVDLSSGKIYFTDTGTNKVCGYADFSPGDSQAYVYDSVQRQVGTLVFGDGLSQLFLGSQLRTFASDATMLCPTAFIAMNQTGVRALKLPDGTIMTGTIFIEGQNGVIVTTYTDNGQSILKLDIVGAPLPTEQDCGDTCPNITEICFERDPGSVFMISQYDTQTVAISSYSYTQNYICASQKAQSLPDENGNLPNVPASGINCSDPCFSCPPVPPPDPGPSVSFCLEVVDLNGNLFILAPSSDDSTNPIEIIFIQQVSQGAPQLQLDGAQNVSDALAAAETFINPPQLTDGLAIGIKGLSQYQ